ncbi:MAG: hypothetical protein ACI9BF_000944 [Candidatus Paceibacteria bacterium]|jgi:hypothetical protein
MLEREIKQPPIESLQAMQARLPLLKERFETDKRSDAFAAKELAEEIRMVEGLISDHNNSDDDSLVELDANVVLSQKIDPDAELRKIHSVLNRHN